jgi:hypothetical protein
MNKPTPAEQSPGKPPKSQRRQRLDDQQQPAPTTAPIDDGDNAGVVADESGIKEGDDTPLAGDWPTTPDVSPH